MADTEPRATITAGMGRKADLEVAVGGALEFGPGPAAGGGLPGPPLHQHLHRRPQEPPLVLEPQLGLDRLEDVSPSAAADLEEGVDEAPQLRGQGPFSHAVGEDLNSQSAHEPRRWSCLSRTRIPGVSFNSTSGLR